MENGDFTDPSQIEDLLFEDELEEEMESSNRPGCLIKIVALLVLFAFTALALPDFSTLLSDKLNFLEQNQALREDEIVQRSKPAVVSVEATTVSGPLSMEVRRGTGFNISSTGTIVTNQHIVADASQITIQFGDGTSYSSSEFEIVPEVDLAIVEISGHDLPTLDLDFDYQVRPGNMVTIIGNPLGFEKISQRGEVGRLLKLGDSQVRLFDIRISINPGNSGSPVLNDQAKVVGIIFASTNFATDDQSEPRALAIPIQALPSH